MADMFVLAALVLMFWAIFNSRQNMLAAVLVLLVLVARSAFYHFKWYKSTGKIY
jgi:hypothetical protein